MERLRETSREFSEITVPYVTFVSCALLWKKWIPPLRPSKRRPTRKCRRSTATKCRFSRKPPPISSEKITLYFIPDEDSLDRPVIIEVRAGAGGEEAALFVAFCIACTHATLKTADGNLKTFPSRQQTSVDSRKLPSRSAA